MAGIRIALFGGPIPGLDPESLPQEAAQDAENADVHNGSLGSFYSPKPVFTSLKAAPKSAFRMYNGDTDYWLTWDTDVDAAKGPLANDADFKVYYTGDGTPKKTNLSLATGAGNYPADYLDWGYPQPGTATVTSTGGTSTTTATGGYFFTYYSSQWKEEGPPSDPTLASYKIDGTNTVVTGTAVTGTSTKHQIDKKRIYRFVASDSGLVSARRVAEIGLGTATFVDNLTVNTDKAVAALPACPSIEFTPDGAEITGSRWEAPPSDAKGLTVGANGMATVFSGREICFLEPYNWHAAPVRYRFALPWEIVGTVADGNVWYIITKGRPVVMAGNHPSSMSQSILGDKEMPGLSKRSIVIGPSGAIFGSAHGLARVGLGSEPGYLTKAVMEEKEWAALIDSTTLIGAMYTGRYFGFFDRGGAKLGFYFDPSSPHGKFMPLNVAVDGVYTDSETAKLYLLRNGIIYEWEGDKQNLMLRMWRSRPFVMDKPINLGAYQVIADYKLLEGSFAEEQAKLAEEAIAYQELLTKVDQDWGEGTAGELKGEMGSHCFGGYYPDTDGPEGSNNRGIMLGGSLALGGTTVPVYVPRELRLDVEVWDYDDNAWRVIFSDQMTDGRAGKMYDADYRADKFSVVLYGNLPTTRVLLGETVEDLKRVP